MKLLVDQAMRDGAIGVSSALQYAPAPYASTDELIALAKEAAKYGGIYATHMRSEGNAIDEALDETFRIGREAGIPIEIWHLKAGGKQNWGRMPEIVDRIDKARASGVDVEADTYAYPAWNNTFSAVVPPWAHEGGDEKMVARLKDPQTRARIRKQMETDTTGWDNEWLEVPGPEGILVSAVQDRKLLPLQGKTIAQIAKSEGKDPIDTAFDLLIQDPSISVTVFAMSEQDVAYALKQPWVSVDNDAHGTAAGRDSGRRTSASTGLWDFPAHSSQVCAR